MNKSPDTNYLDQFPPEYHQFIKDKFYTAYVFTEDSYEFGQEDTIQLAKGPKEMKARVKANMEKLLTLGPTAEQVAVIEAVLPTIDGAGEFLIQVKKEIDAIWARSRDYQVLHPKKETKPAYPATDKQIKFLESLGCLDIPKSKAEATRLIDIWKNKRINN